MKQGTVIGIGCGFIALVIIVSVLMRPAETPATNARVLQGYTKQAQDAQAAAQQAQRDTQALADKVTQQQKDLDAAVAKLNGTQRDSEGNPKEGRPEQIGPGNVIEFTASDALAFMFVEKTGFVKKFYPVCPNTNVPGNKTLIINYHWERLENQRGQCYAIDGITIVP